MSSLEKNMEFNNQIQKSSNQNLFKYILFANLIPMILMSLNATLDILNTLDILDIFPETRILSLLFFIILFFVPIPINHHSNYLSV